MKIIYLIILLFLTNCSINKVSDNHGVKLSENKLNQILLQSTNQNDALKILGPPSTISEFDQNTWIYINRTKTTKNILSLGDRKIIKNDILVLKFNNRGVLEEKRILSLDDMNNIKFDKDTTNKDFGNSSFMYSVLSSLREKINAPTKRRKKTN
tara:strand:- start:118 stop:579 length:462 start_codon:yes stop_codon:yes gene_type:complete